MINNQVNFSCQESCDVCIQRIQGDPWFFLRDVCDILTVDRTSRLLPDLDKKGLAGCHTLTKGGEQENQQQPSSSGYVARKSSPTQS